MSPFFSPGAIEHPDIPIYIAGVNEHLCRLAGEMCQGFHVHPFHTVRYLKELVIPNIEQGAQQSRTQPRRLRAGPARSSSSRARMPGDQG